MHGSEKIAHGGSAPRSAVEERLANASQVLRAILKREADGLPINHTAVLREDGALHHAIRRVFGTWDCAMKAAGINPDQVRRHRRWNRQAVIRRILQRAAEGLPLYMGIVEKTECTLPSAAVRWFGSWGAALQAAGIDPAPWFKRVPTWTRERVGMGGCEMTEIKRIRQEVGALIERLAQEMAECPEAVADIAFLYLQKHPAWGRNANATQKRAAHKYWQGCCQACKNPVAFQEAVFHHRRRRIPNLHSPSNLLPYHSPCHDVEHGVQKGSLSKGAPVAKKR